MTVTALGPVDTAFFEATDAADPTPTPQDDRYRVSPYVLLRFNPIQGTVAGTSTAARTLADLLDRLSAVDLGRREIAEPVHAHLYALVPHADKAQRSKVLLPASRNVVNQRALGVSREALGDLATHPLVARWLLLDEEEAHVTAILEDAVGELLTVERAALQDVLGDPRFQAAAALTSTQLSLSAHRYASIELGRHAKAQRKTEPKLLRYAERATNKTSPFSWFTAVAYGAWSDQQTPQTPQPAGATLPVTAHATVNTASVLRLRDDALRVDALRAAIRHDLAPGLRRDGDQWAFDTLRDDPARRMRVHGAVRHDISVRSTPVGDTVIAALRELGPLTLHQLAQEAGARLQIEPAALLPRLIKLATVGLLVADLPVDELSADPLADFAADLRAIDTPPARELAERVEAVAAATRAVEATIGAERCPRMDDLEAAWTAAFAQVDATPAVAARVYEDIVADSTVAVSEHRWSQVLDDFSRLGAALAPMNNTYIGQQLVAVEVADRIGTRGRIPYDEYVAMLPDIFATAATTVPAMLERIGDRAPELDQLLSLREPFVEAFATLGEEAVIPEDLVAATVARMPARYRDRRISMSGFFQALTEHDGVVDQAVLNTVLGGYGQFTSRFLSQQRDGEHLGLLREHLRRTLPADAVEFRPVHGFNANIHPALLPRQFAVPGMERGLGSDPFVSEIVDTHQLWIGYDQQLGELRLFDADGNTITPFYMGFLVPYLLPYDLAGLYMLSPTSLVKPDLTGDLEERLAPEQRDQVRHYPPVRFGSVVVVRRRWFVPGELFPRQQSGEAVGEYLRRLDRWREQHRIPSRVYISAAPDLRASELDKARQEALGGRKPNLVDLRSPLHLRCLDNIVGDYSTLRITEAAPDPAQRSADPHVAGSTAEYLIELY